MGQTGLGSVALGSGPTGGESWLSSHSLARPVGNLFPLFCFGETWAITGPTSGGWRGEGCKDGNSSTRTSDTQRPRVVLCELARREGCASCLQGRVARPLRSGPAAQAHTTLPTVSRSCLNAPTRAVASRVPRPRGPRASLLNKICPFYGDKADLHRL